MANRSYTPEERQRRRAVYGALANFWRCPNTGRILQADPDDNKVLCGCGKTNPRLLRLSPKSDETGGILGGPAHHFKKFMDSATVDDFIDQEIREEAVRN